MADITGKIETMKKLDRIYKTGNEHKIGQAEGAIFVLAMDSEEEPDSPIPPKDKTA